MTRKSPREIENALDRLQEDEADSGVGTIVHVPEDARREGRELSEWWESERIDREWFTITVERDGDPVEQLATPHFLPEDARGVVVLFPSEIAVLYLQYSEEQRATEREARREAGDPIPDVLAPDFDPEVPA